MIWLSEWIFVPYVFRRYWSGDVTSTTLTMPCCSEYGMIPESLLIWAQTTTTASEYGIIRKPLVATRTNED